MKLLHSIKQHPGFLSYKLTCPAFRYDLGRSTFYKVAAIGIAYFACSLIESSVEIFAKEVRGVCVPCSLVA